VDLGVFEEMKWLFSFMSEVGRSSEVAEVFRTEKHTSDAAFDSVGRWPGI
jgi:hypothetical protein